jgi:putative flippase GtrA
MSGTSHLLQRARFLRFAVVGGAATVVYAVLAWALTLWLGMPAVPASVASYGFAALVSYFGHRRLTFRSDRPHGEAVSRFLGVTATGYVVSLVAPLLLTDLLDLHAAISIATTCIVVPLLNYVGLSRLVFATA